MATTTPDAIVTAVEELIAALTPAGEMIPGMEKEYETTAERHSHIEWELRPGGDIDRNFQVSEFEIESFEMFGNRSERAVVARMVLQIGHMIGNYIASRNRRLKDIMQITAQLTWPPTIDGISALQYIHPDVSVTVAQIKTGKFFITSITFSVRFSLSANYGG